MGGACSRHGRDERSFERPRRRWENNIIMDLSEIGWEDVDWIRLAQDSDQLRVLVNLQVP
jgi:hypothetical protein